MAQSGCPGRRGRYDERAGDGAGIGDLTTSGQHLPALRLRSLGSALATARGDRRHGDRAYADDIVVGFEHEADGRRFLDMMRERLAEFALTLHPEKTRL